jgi:hypothetical protein
MPALMKTSQRKFANKNKTENQYNLKEIANFAIFSFKSLQNFPKAV